MAHKGPADDGKRTSVPGRCTMRAGGRFSQIAAKYYILLNIGGSPRGDRSVGIGLDGRLADDGKRSGLSESALDVA